MRGLAESIIRNQLLLRGASMQLKPFLLDAWLDQYEHDIEFNLAASTGPAWTVNDILALADDETLHRFLNHNLVYSRPAGADSLREAIAEIKQLADANTKLILVNSPHNPTGATIGDAEMEALHDFAAERGIQLVSDEVYHPIYHGRQTKSAARLPHVTVISDLSKAFSIP